MKTLDDEFNGTALNSRLWQVYGDNYWDQASHWSKDDVLVGGGAVKLRYEKKTGFNNDDPTQKKTDYAAGYLHTYGGSVDLALAAYSAGSGAVARYGGVPPYAETQNAIRKVRAIYEGNRA